MAEPPTSGLSGKIPHRPGRSLLWGTPSFRDLFYRCVAELVGTWLMVFVGTSVVAAAVLAGAQAGLWQVAVVWALGVSTAIYLTGAVSGAHLNPAVSLAFALFRPRDFPIRLLLPYWVSQLAGSHPRRIDRTTPLSLLHPALRAGARYRAGRPRQPAFDHDVRRILPQPRNGGCRRGCSRADHLRWEPPPSRPWARAYWC